MSTSDPRREVTPAFRSRVREWVEAAGEVLLVLRYLYGAGSKDFAICRSMEEFERLVSVVPLGAEIIAFKNPQLSLRGRADRAFCDAALQALPGGTEFLVVTLRTRSDSIICEDYAEGCSTVELHEALLEFYGQDVACGACPPFLDPDDDTMISASKGGINGPR